MQDKLKIGDLVQIIGPCRHGFTEDVGDRFVINRVSDDEKEFTGDCNCLYPASSLRLVEKLKIGDWVLIVGPDWADVIRSHDPEKAYQICEKTEAGNFAIREIGIFPAASLRKCTPGEIQQRLATPMPVHAYDMVEERLKWLQEQIDKKEDRLSAIESRLNSLVPSHAALLGDVEALAEKMGAIEKRLTSIEKRQREQHERMDRFMQDYREHKDFDFDMHDRIKVLEGEKPEVCELPLTDLGAIADIASFGPVPECIASFIRHESEEAEKRKQKGTCDEEDCKPNMKPIRITIQIGKNKVYIMHPETCCPGDALKWCETVLDSMRGA